MRDRLKHALSCDGLYSGLGSDGVTSRPGRQQESTWLPKDPRHREPDRPGRTASLRSSAPAASAQEAEALQHLLAAHRFDPVGSAADASGPCHDALCPLRLAWLAEFD